MAQAPTTDDRIDELFGLAPEEFVTARNRLAKDLKSAGDTEGAAAVRKLRRPTAAASAVNRLVREAPDEIGELVALGDRLREAHAALVAGGGNAGIREATARRRKLVGSMTRQALAFAGGGEAHREAIADTLDAAVVDAGAAEAVRAGRLTRELEAPSTFGAGLLIGDDVSPAASGRRPPKDSRVDPSPANDDIDKEEAEQVAAEGRRRAEQIERLQEEVDLTSRAAEDAAEEAEAARHEVGRLRDLLDSARARLRTAEDTERATRAAAQKARRELKNSAAP